MAYARQPYGNTRCFQSQGFSNKFVLAFILALLLSPIVYSQVETATISGVINDQSGGIVVDVEVRVINEDTSVTSMTTSNQSGVYLVTGLKPGRYRVHVAKEGFKGIDLTDLILSVQDSISRNFVLQIGSTSQTISVEASPLSINTADASVSTIIDRNFIASLPLNGRSFNTLLQLTPGVVIAPSSNAAPGQFSIAGQRTDANNFTVDGVSASFGVSPTGLAGTSGTGSAPAFSTLGGTSSLVSVEALQEFRIETSSYAPEFGRSPGGQVILTTRSGTNEFHGGVYEYFRNDALDANDWFANAAGKPRAAERHNDFGGFLGGPLLKGKTFFFLSYEGARLRLPQAMLTQVPSEWARTVAASPAVVPFLNAYPQPDDRTVVPGVYTSNFVGVWSNGATLNAGSVRIDHNFNDRLSLFGRYDDAPSEFAQRQNSLTQVSTIQGRTRTLTIGLNKLFGSSTSNTLRGNYSTQNAGQTNYLDSFGGGVPLDPSLILGSLSSASNSAEFSASGTAYIIGLTARNKTTQFNLVDDITTVVGTHQLKFGADYRGILLDITPPQYGLGAFPFTFQAFVSTGKAFLVASLVHPSRFFSQSLSTFAQDSWKVTPRLTLTYGLRWELSPAPSAREGTTLASWTNVDNPPQIALAPVGTPLWGTTYGNFAPRVGLAYSLTAKGDFVLRVGWGLFYDLGIGSSASLAVDFPNTISKNSPGVSLPIADASPFLPSQSLQPPYTGHVLGFSPNLTLPRSYQWNVAVEKLFGGKQALTLTYVGQAGRDLLRTEAIFKPNANFSGDFLLTQNDARSNYNALQLQFRRPLAARIQLLLNYTWSHSLDNASNDQAAALTNTVISAASDYASSDFDVRHSFSGALTYAVPALRKSGPLSVVSRDWSIDAVTVARSGFPFNAVENSVKVDPASNVKTRPDLVPGQPFWLSTPMAPGGKSLNPNAFMTPSTIRQGNEGRNDIPGFGLTQVDVSIARKFPMTERLSLQFRADAFNVLNHPNFTNPLGFFEFGSTFLSSQQMLNQSLGGLNALFQEGGPRSLQLSLKMTF